MFPGVADLTASPPSAHRSDANFAGVREIG